MRKEVPEFMMFADEILLCGVKEVDMTEHLDTWGKSLRERGLRVSRPKTQFMDFTRKLRALKYIHLYKGITGNSYSFQIILIIIIKINITYIALKSSWARARKRNKTKSLIKFKSRGHRTL